MDRPVVLLVSNIPAPYRVELFYYMMQKYSDFNFQVLYTNASEDNRKWAIDGSKMMNSTILSSRMLKIKTKYDYRYIHLPKNFFQTIKNINPDIIIGVEYNLAAIKTLFWAKIHKKPYIHLTDGTLLSERTINKIQKISRKLIIANSNAFIASSTKAKEKLEYWGAASSRISISLLSTDLDMFTTAKRCPEKGRILYVGSTAKRKGLDLLIEALSYVNNKYELVVVGNNDDTECNELRNLAHEKGINMIWLGFKQGNELINEYKRAEFFVLPTREDCFGLVLVEAMATGIPILSSKYADGAYDVIQAGVNGELVDPYEAKAFAEAIDRMLLESEKYSIDEATLEKFRFENVADGYYAAIKMALNENNDLV